MRPHTMGMNVGPIKSESSYSESTIRPIQK